VDCDIESVLYRIVSGYYYISIDKYDYKIILPDLRLKQKAHSVYMDIMDEYKFDDLNWISPNAISILLKHHDIWNDQKEIELKQLLKVLDNSKIELYKNFSNTTLKEKIIKIISSTKQSINDYYNKKHYFDYMTLEHYASSIKNQFLIANTVYNQEGQKLFDQEDIDTIDTVLLDKILLQIYSNNISLEDLKALARHDCWKSFWGVSQDNIFPGSAKDWTDEQRSLINFSKTLDAIREHMESPPEEIIDNDDALDGWMLYQQEKVKKEKAKQHISEKYGLDRKNAGEVFLLTQDVDETKEIFGLNDPTTNMEIREMHKVLKDNEEGMKWSELPHVKRQLNKELHDMSLNRSKG